MKKKLVSLLLIGTLVMAPQMVAAEEFSKTSEQETVVTDVSEEGEAIHYDIREKGGTFEADAEGNYHYTLDGQIVKNAFFCDGTYTYYLQNDGTPMTDRLTYHPDGEHIICFDQDGHEVFDRSYNVKKSIEGNPVDDICYFGTYGYMYVNQTAFIVDRPCYYNAYGVLQIAGWFKFVDGNYGYADRDGYLAYNTFGYNPWGQKVFYNWDGTVARGLIADDFYYYDMDKSDGHLIGSWQKNQGETPAWKPAEGSLVKANLYDMYVQGDNCVTRETADHNAITYLAGKNDPKEDWQLWVYKDANGNETNSVTHNNDKFITNRGIMLGMKKQDVIDAYGEGNQFFSGICENGVPNGGDYGYISNAFGALPTVESGAEECLKNAVDYSGYEMESRTDDCYAVQDIGALTFTWSGVRFYYDKSGTVIMIQYFMEHMMNAVQPMNK